MKKCEVLLSTLILYSAVVAHDIYEREIDMSDKLRSKYVSF